MDELVSIIVPVYNAGELLRPAVVSVLNQEYANIEVIVVDDGSTDGCMETIADLSNSRLIRLRQDNRGKAAAVNLALDRASGQYWMLQDADDSSLTHRVSVLHLALTDDPNLFAVFSGIQVNIGMRALAYVGEARGREECHQIIQNFRMPAHDATGMYRMSAVGKLRMNPKFRIGQGLDFILRVGEKGPVKVLPDILYVHRIHSQSNTHKNYDNVGSQIESVRRAAHERRGLDYKPTPPAKLNDSRFLRHRKVSTVVSYCMMSVCQLKDQGEYRKALKVAWRCLSLHPCDPLYYKPFVRWLLPRNHRS